MTKESNNKTESEPLVFPEIEGYLARKTFPEIELPKIFNTHDHLVIFDIGACEGEDSIRYARLFPNSRVYTFEPLPENQTLVLANFKKFEIKNAELQGVALADREGISTFHVSSGKPPDKWEGEQWNYGNKSSSLLEPIQKEAAYGWLDFKKTITVKCKILDLFCMEKGVSKINFIHLDVQGAELMVLRGAQNILPKIQTVWMEVGEKGEYSGQATRNEVEKYMKANRFRLLYFRSDGQWGDQFWVNTRFPTINLFLLKKFIKNTLKHFTKNAKRLIR